MLFSLKATAATLVWDPNAETPEGYNVYYSALPDVSLQKRNVGLATSFDVSFAQPGKTYTFYVTAYDSGGILESEPSETLTYTPQAGVTPPAIATAPISLSVTVGGTASFTVAATGTAPLSYQWLLNNSPITGATSPTYSISSVQAAHAGSYSVRISNSAGSVVSAPATLTVIFPPSILSQPASNTLNQGERLALAVSASGSGPLTYQWFKNGSAITGANAFSFNISSVQASDAGVYSVRISNSAGSLVSASANISVITPPVITSHPSSQTVNAGSDLTLSVLASSTGALSYQWQKNGTNLTGATSATITISGIKAVDAGSYQVRVSNSAGVGNSAVAVITVIVPPTIAAHPSSQNPAFGSTVSLSVTASGSAPLSYQWLKFGINIPSATASTLVLTNVTGDHSGAYSVRVSNPAGAVTSSSATITVISPPVITSQPASQNVNAGARLTLSVQVTGTLPLTYQWSKNGTAIVGASASSYELASVDSSASGNYTVQVSNPAGSVNSAVASVTVISPPTITLQPVSKTVAYGSPLMLQVQATGSAPLACQWRKDGVLIPGATGLTYSISSADTQHSGVYVAELSNTAGSVVSAPAVVTVALPGAPAIAQQPANVFVSVGAAFSLSVNANGAGPFSFQWYKNGIPISGATSSSYSVAIAASSHAGEYRVRVSNVGGETLSASAQVTVGVPPTVTVPPSSKTAEVGTTVVFSVTVSGTAPFTYRWFRGGIPIVGATGATLTIEHALISDAGQYDVEVSNSAGNTLSAAATLTVTGLPAIVTGPVSTTVAYGGTVSLSVQASGAAPLLYRWIKDGTYLPGATNSTLVIPTADPSHEGSYSVEVSNAGGLVTSSAATVRVGAPVAPAITKHPASIEVEIGGAVSLSVEASGTQPLSYQWLRNGAVLAGATNATLVMAVANISDAGIYRVYVNNAGGSILSEAATVTVGSAPVITQQPLSRTVLSGSPVSFSVQAQGSSPLSYRWAKDGVYLQGKTSSALGIPAATVDDAGSYTVEVRNPVGSIMSSVATLIVTTSTSTNSNPIPPAITRQPENTSADPGTVVSFTAEVTGTGPLRYRWILNGSYLSGATNLTLTIPSVTLSNAGTYVLEVSGPGGSIASQPATLNLTGAPVIIISPQSQTISAGSSLALSVQVSGSAPFTYRWIKSGVILPEATGPTLTFHSVQPSDEGTYSVEISNGAGRVVSAPATIMVQTGSSGGGSGSQSDPPLILRNPATIIAQIGSTATFSIEATASSSISYRWIKNGSYIPGATSPTLIISPIALSDAGSYIVQLESKGGTVVSAPAALVVTGAPSLISQPKSEDLTIGAPLLLRVEVEGVRPLTYRWVKGGAYIPGATNETFSIGAVTLADSGSYYVEVSNGAGRVVSQVAVITVNAAGSYIEWQPQSQSAMAGESVFLYVEASSVFDLTYRWIRNGSYIPGANLFYLHLPSVSKADEGVYSVEVSSIGGTEVSSPATLTVNGEPEITRQPQSTTVDLGSSFSLSVEVTGGEPFTYRWVKSGSVVPGATNRVLEISSARFSDGGTYFVEISNGAGSAKSDPAVIVVSGAPVVVTPPQSTNVMVGGLLTLSVETRGVSPMTYQWIKNGSIIGTTSTNRLTISPVKVSDDGDYSVRVVNGAGEDTSASAKVTVDGAPVILTQPSSRTVAIGDSLTLSVQVQGAAPFTYRWIKNGSYITGATDVSYQVPSVTQQHQGNYSVEIVNGAGRVVSQTAVVSVSNEVQGVRLGLSANSGASAYSLVLSSSSGSYAVQYTTNLNGAWATLLQTNLAGFAVIEIPKPSGNIGFFRVLQTP